MLSYHSALGRVRLMIKILVIGIGGFVGAIARYGISGLVHRASPGSFPFGTLAVNVLGCLLIGALMTIVEDRQPFTANVRLFLFIGLLGSFTTFSTLGYETFEYLKADDFKLGMYNVLLNVVIGISAVIAGRLGVKYIFAHWLTA